MFGSPDPYLKLYLTSKSGEAEFPYHGQQQLSSVQYNTADPSWGQEVIMILLY